MAEERISTRPSNGAEARYVEFRVNRQQTGCNPSVGLEMLATIFKEQDWRHVQAHTRYGGTMGFEPYFKITGWSLENLVRFVAFWLHPRERGCDPNFSPEIRKDMEELRSNVLRMCEPFAESGSHPYILEPMERLREQIRSDEGVIVLSFPLETYAVASRLAESFTPDQIKELVAVALVERARIDLAEYAGIMVDPLA